MRILSTLFLATALSTLSLGAALAQATLTVTGAGTVETAPDMATVSLGVTTNGPTAAAALSANSEAVARVIARLTALNVAAADIQTSNLSLNPNWVTDAQGMSVTDGFLAMNMVTVRIRALDQTGAVLDAVVADGANSLNGLYFSLQDSRAAEAEARKKAVEDARARAEALASAAGVALGPLVSITEGGMASPLPGPMYRMDAAAPVPVEAGSVGVTSSVTIVWQIAE